MCFPHCRWEVLEPHTLWRSPMHRHHQVCRAKSNTHTPNVPAAMGISQEFPNAPLMVVYLICVSLTKVCRHLL